MTTRFTRRLPHWRQDGSTYFVTWRVRPDQPKLTDNERSVVCQAICHFDRQRYELAAFVVMDDHVHVMLALERAASAFGNRPFLEDLHGALYPEDALQRRQPVAGRVFRPHRARRERIPRESELHTEQSVYAMAGYRRLPMVGRRPIGIVKQRRGAGGAFGSGQAGTPAPRSIREPCLESRTLAEQPR